MPKIDGEIRQAIMHQWILARRDRRGDGVMEKLARGKLGIAFRRTQEAHDRTKGTLSTGFSRPVKTCFFLFHPDKDDFKALANVSLIVNAQERLSPRIVD